MEELGTTCSICAAASESAQVQRCRICLRRFCGDCAVRSRSGAFCSQGCADIFFYGVDDEPRDDE